MASFKELTNSEKPLLIDFHADWCGPCKTLGPYIDQVKKELGDKIKVIKIDVDRNQQLAGSLGIQGVPTLMIYKQGEMLWRQSGVVPPHTLKAELEKYVG